jgi:hypothetical protein
MTFARTTFAPPPLPIPSSVGRDRKGRGAESGTGRLVKEGRAWAR